MIEALQQAGMEAQLPTALAIILAVVVGILVYAAGRRWVTIPQDFGYIDTMSGGPISGASIVMLDGEPGSGRSEVAEAIVDKGLSSGLKALVVSYELPLGEFLRRADYNGHQLSDSLRTGILKILDCQSPLVGSFENELLRDPYNLTHINIAINGELDKFEGQSYLLVLDSLVPLFNRLNPKVVIDFVQAIGVRVRKGRGIFVVTTTSRSVASEVNVRLASMMDGAIETRLTSFLGRRRRTLTVKWMRERKALDARVRFDVVPGKGVVFRVSPR